ncbi:MAG: hypothetical protein JRN06_13145 [Nitrososphaerota archaeon]|nr:hypothetical protein [Nitrososphaerota archaeon]MDG7009149.1 hypothetical protein [Nitrososphaerota archaeon]
MAKSAELASPATLQQGVPKSNIRVADYIRKTTKTAVEKECDLIHCNAFYPVIAGGDATAQHGRELSREKKRGEVA